MTTKDLTKQSLLGTVPWKLYVVTVIESLLAFYLASFSIAIYFLHQGSQSLTTSILLIALYIFVIVVSIKRIINKFHIAALMLLIPIAPLVILLLFPFFALALQWFQ